jgi:hypothetical protein
MCYGDEIQEEDMGLTIKLSQVLMLLKDIWEVPSSNIGGDIEYYG